MVTFIILIIVVLIISAILPYIGIGLLVALLTWIGVKIYKNDKIKKHQEELTRAVNNLAAREVELQKLYDGQYGIHYLSALQQLAVDYYTDKFSYCFQGANVDKSNNVLSLRHLGVRGINIGYTGISDGIRIHMCTPFNFKSNDKEEYALRFMRIASEFYIDYTSFDYSQVSDILTSSSDLIEKSNLIEQKERNFLESLHIRELENYMLLLELYYSLDDIKIIDEKLVCDSAAPTLIIRLLPNGNVDVAENEFSKESDESCYYRIEEDGYFYIQKRNVIYTSNFIRSKKRQELEEWDSEIIEVARYIISTGDVAINGLDISDIRAKLIKSILVSNGIISENNKILMSSDTFEHYIGSSENPSISSNKNMDNMNGIEFEEYCAAILRANGYTNVTTTPASNDQGVDLLAEKDNIKYAIQCKCYSSQLGNTPIQEINAGKTIYGCNAAIVMTNSTFTASGISAAKATGVALWDRNIVTEMAKALKS